jgi:hypothetical protein
VDDVTAEPFRVENGAITVPGTTAPGLEVDGDKVNRHRVAG